MKWPIGKKSIEICIGDITHQASDAIVNAANSRLAGGGGVDGAIHLAGGPAIIEETRQKYPQGCASGSAVISGAGRLSARFVIHAVGPTWHGGNVGEPELLAKAYRRCFELAFETGCRSIAMPAISCGVYGYPIDKGATVALTAASMWACTNELPLDFRWVLFSQANYDEFEAVGMALLNS